MMYRSAPTGGKYPHQSAPQDMLKITIAIPTYKRTEKLLSRVRELLPQLGNQDRLLIFDNASPGFTPEHHPELRDTRIGLTVNNANIGGNANIATCVSSIREGWLWLLSDDDPIEPDAIQILRAEIARADDCCYINFAAKGMKQRSGAGRIVHGLGEFLDHNDGFENTLLISNCVFNITALAPHMQQTYNAIPMNCAQLAAVIARLQDGGSSFYSPHSLVSWNEPDLKQSWPIVSVYHLLELASLVRERALAKKLLHVIAKALPPRLRFVAELCQTQLLHGEDWRIRPYARRVLKDLSVSGSITNWVTGYILYLSLRSPRTTLSVLALAYRVGKGKSLYATLQGKRFQQFL
jgi:glycosyltransferase involved in cell wall biosynthesis